MTKPDHQIYETLTELCHTQNLEPADVARAVDMQPGTFQRSIQGNPTIKLIKRVGWALGIDWMWLGLDPAKVKDWVATRAIRFDGDSPAWRAHQVASENRLTKKRKVKRSLGVDVTDKDVLRKQYPGKAIEGEVLDTNYIEFEPPAPPRHINEESWERRRKDLGQGLPEHLVMTDKAIEAGFAYEEYTKRGWTLEMLADEALICERGQEGK